MARAVVVGAGIGGLCAAIGLRRRGWDVTVLERAPVFGPVGSGLTLMANGLRGLSALGVGEAVRHAGRVDAGGGARTHTGRWLSRLDGDRIERVLGTPAVGIHRATLHEVLRAALPDGTVVTGTEVADVVSGPPPAVRHRVVSGAGGTVPGAPDALVELAADLVVGADGINSAIRRRLWPDSAPPEYIGTTSWRGVTAQPWTARFETAISWGPGTEFGMVPLGDGRVYWYAAEVAPEHGRAPGGDEMAEVRARFGHWHEPIPALLDATDPGAVIRTDLRHLAEPLPSYHRGGVVLLGDAAHAMPPHLGQGANQAIEDAVVLAACCPPPDGTVAGGERLARGLAEYDRQRRPRTQRVAKAAAQTARFGQQMRNRFAIGLRNTVIRLTPARFALRSMAGHAAWDPPRIEPPATPPAR